MKIIDNFLSPEGLEEIRNMILKTKFFSGVRDTVITGTELSKKNSNTDSATFWAIDKNAPADIHQDIGVVLCVFYPWNKLDAPLEITREKIDVIENRMVIFDGELHHRQIKPKDGIRYSVSMIASDSELIKDSL